jgi:hypothetical protein
MTLWATTNQPLNPSPSTHDANPVPSAATTANSMNRLTWRGFSRPSRHLARESGARSGIEFGRLRKVATALEVTEKHPNVRTKRRP